MAQLINDFGRIHIVINNAGINIRGPIDELTLTEFQEVIDTNVTGVWLVCRAAAPYLKAQRYGRVINIGSTLSIIAIAERTPYASSKGAVLQIPVRWPWNGRRMGSPPTPCYPALLRPK